MKRLTIALLLLSGPAWAQSKPPDRNDPCKPIGRTEDGKLVYSMKCDRLPVVTAPPSPAPTAATAPPVQEDEGGLFRNPFPSLIKPSTDVRQPGLGPPR